MPSSFEIFEMMFDEFLNKRFFFLSSLEPAPRPLIDRHLANRHFGRQALDMQTFDQKTFDQQTFWLMQVHLIDRYLANRHFGNTMSD